MITQYKIEQAAGITDQQIANYMMEQETPAARSAMSLLQMQCKFYEPHGFELLKAAVRDCRNEMRRGLAERPEGCDCGKDRCDV